MKRFFKRQSEGDLGAQLHRTRPQPPAELMQSLTERVAGESHRHRRPYARARIAAAGIPIIGMLVVFGAFGGIGYAASTVKGAVVTARTVVFAPLESTKSDSNNNNQGNNNNNNQSNNQNNNDNQGNNDNKGGNDQGHHGDDGGEPDDHEYGHHKKMCHKHGDKEETIDVSDSAVPAHLAQGDTVGECKKPKH